MRSVSLPRLGDLTFRTAIETDVDAIVGLVESAYRGESSRAGWTTEADLLGGQRTDADGVLAMLTTAGSAMLLGEDQDGALLACCHVERRLEGAYFGMFAVSPARQGGGLGDAMLRIAERHAVDTWHAAWIDMQVIAQRAELIAWYERRGYHLTGETRPFPYDDERFGRPLRPDLVFVVLRRRLDVAAEDPRRQDL